MRSPALPLVCSAITLLAIAACSDSGSSTGYVATGGTGIGGAMPGGTGAVSATGGAEVGGTGGVGTGGVVAGGTGGATGGTGGVETGGTGGGDTGGTGGGDTGGTGGGDTGGTGGSTGGTGGSTGGTGGSTGGTGGTGGSTGGTGGSTQGCTPGQMLATGNLTGQWGALKPVIGGQEYFLQVNEWNSSAAQTMAYGGDYYFRMTQQEASTSTSGGPTGFPSMFIGANSGNFTSGSNLPKQVSALTNVPTTWNWSDGGTLSNTSANSYNVTYDVWFSTNSGGDPDAYGPSGGYLMVWLYDPPDAEPIGGTAAFSGVTIPNVDGTWDIWIGTNGGRPCISYLRTQTTMSASFDLVDFIQDAVQNRPSTIQNNWYLSNVFIGFEIWRGGVGLETTNFCVTVE